MHGRVEEAEAVVRDIEAKVGVAAGGAHAALAMRALRSVSWGEVLHVLVVRYRRRAVLGADADGVAGLLLQRHLLHLRADAHALLRHPRGARGLLHLSRSRVGNFLGPLVLGRLFDTRRPARHDRRSPTRSPGSCWSSRPTPSTAAGSRPARRPLCWSAIFFFASAAASSAYLTVSEVFPLEMRAISISLFYARGHRARRLRRAAAVRRDDRRRQPRRALRRLRPRRRAHVRRRARRVEARRGRRAPSARGGVPAARDGR